MFKTTYNKALTAFFFYPRGIRNEASIIEITKANKAVRILKNDLLTDIEGAIKALSDTVSFDKKNQPIDLEQWRKISDQIQTQKKEMREIDIPTENLVALKSILENIKKGDMEKGGNKENDTPVSTLDLLNLEEFIEDIDAVI